MAGPNTTAVLKRVQVLEEPRDAVPKRKELQATGVMQVPRPCTPEEFERVAIPMQAALMKFCEEDRNK